MKSCVVELTKEEFEEYKRICKSLGLSHPENPWIRDNDCKMCVRLNGNTYSRKQWYLSNYGNNVEVINFSRFKEFVGKMDIKFGWYKLTDNNCLIKVVCEVEGTNNNEGHYIYHSKDGCSVGFATKTMLKNFEFIGNNPLVWKEISVDELLSFDKNQKVMLEDSKTGSMDSQYCIKDILIIVVDSKFVFTINSTMYYDTVKVLV